MTRKCNSLLLFVCLVVRNFSAETQPLVANAQRIVTALQSVGHPLTGVGLQDAIQAQDGAKIERILDEQALFVVDINPELRVKVARGPAKAILQQAGFTPFIVKVNNHGTVSQRLNISSPQAGPVYAGAAQGILERQQQTELKRNENTNNVPDRFLEVEILTSPPMTEQLSGLEVEYALALIYAAEAGRREATISFDIGQGTQDIGFRAEVPVLFETQPAIPVKVSIRDFKGEPTVASLTFRDPEGRIFPPQPKRLAPDLFFEPQIYRADGGIVLLPPGRFELTYGRGPEYRELKKEVIVPESGTGRVEVKLERWINPAEFGFYNGDHHIHAAGCSHYEIPTQGIMPPDMFLQVKGEGLNVGCVLTWGPCYDFQRRFFSPITADISEPFTILKYDIEVSGFGSQALGHVCLLNLRNQTYPGSDGTKIKGWPTWTVPVLRWTKEQGGVTGYPHSDMAVDPAGYARRILERYDANHDSLLDRAEGGEALLAKPFAQIDTDADGRLSARELSEAADRAGNELPNLVLPSMRGSGAMEIFVSTAEGVCDFISTMNTGRIGEWNTWYHILNCGFPLKVSGETDFPCMSSRRVGQGRVYVQLGTNRLEKLDFTQWCNALGQGRSYVSDGYAHALAFSVNETAPGYGSVALEHSGKVSVRARVAFAPEIPKAVAYGTLETETRRYIGDTVLLHAPRNEESVVGGGRLVEIVMNGEVVGKQEVPADGAVHDLSFEIEVKRSSWIALRQFPQLHTNPVDILVGGEPIRASKSSALWCAESVELLWDNRSRFIAEAERPAARAAYDRAVGLYKSRAAEADVQASGKKSTFTNPINPGPDPWMQFYKGNYYLTTTQGDRIRMWKGSTVAGLKTAEPVTVWKPDDPSRSAGIWAPEFHLIGGRWYLYFTAMASNRVDTTHRMHVLESDGDDPLGPYHYKGRLFDPENDLYAIDGSVFQHPGDRRWYFLWAAHPGHRIRIARMENPWTLEGKSVQLEAAGFGCEEVREGPCVLRRNGRLFLTYSACDTGKPDYKIGMLIADEKADVLNKESWKQYPEPVFERNDGAEVFGPGHHGFFRSPDGTEDWIVYHAKTTSKYTYAGRTTRVQKFSWHADGTPDFGKPLPLSAEISEPSR